MLLIELKYIRFIFLGIKNGVAEVEWQLNPDAMYYRDEDGFGMTDDEEIKFYGAIDRKGKVVKKFTLKRL